MKVLFCDNSLYSLINFRGDIINSYVEANWEVVLLAPLDFDYIPNHNNIRYIEIQLSRTGLNPFRDLKYFCTLSSIYKKERPDYIFHYTIKPNIYGTVAATLLHIRSTSMITGLGYVFNSINLGGVIARFMYRIAMSFPEHIIALNQHIVDLLIEKHISTVDKIILLSGGEGVNLSLFGMRTDSKRNDNKTIFLMIARILYDKGYSEYVNAARIIRNEFPDVKFLLLGSLDYDYPNHVPKEVLKKDVEDGAIEYLGFQQNVRDIINKCDCIVLPSYHEGLSRVLMEALAMQKPIITTDIPGCRETVDPDRNGYIVKAHSVESLADGIRKFLALSEDERKQMGIYGRRKAEKEFDVKNVIAVYKKITDRLQTNQDNHHE